MVHAFQDRVFFCTQDDRYFSSVNKVNHIMPNDLDLRDDFDFALEALETARIAMRSDKEGAAKMATNILAGKRQLKRAEAQGLIAQATKYLDG